MKYFVRALKWFASICVFYLVVSLLTILLIALANGLDAPLLAFENQMHNMFNTTRYLPLLGFIVICAALYPKFGFASRAVEGSIAENRKQIVDAFCSEGYILDSEADGVMGFRAKNRFLKIMMLGDDEIKVSQEGHSILLNGKRRVVLRVKDQLDSNLQSIENE